MPHTDNTHKLSLEKAKELQLWKSNLEFAIEEGLVETPTEKVLSKFISCHHTIKLIKKKVKLLAEQDTPTLVLGETGTGKELIATALHGSRKGKFVPVNCAGIPDTLLEAEFFGCVPGAFTGATNRPGVLEEASEGTLFLDEIGDMPFLLQAKLLRVLQEKVARRLGSTQTYKVTCRFVSATNRNPKDILNNKEFRLDLYYRLAVITLELPNLYTRGEADIDLLVQHFFKPATVPTEFLGLLKQRLLVGDLILAGNVRQLQSMIEEYKLMEKLLCLQ